MDDNQCMVADQWLTEARELQITIESDNRKITEKITLFNEGWVPLKHRQLSVSNGNDMIAGFEILKQGVPPIKVGWVNEDSQFEPNAMGGAMGKLPIDKLLAAIPMDYGYGGTMTPSAIRNKKRVADYFVAQIILWRRLFCVARQCISPDNVFRQTMYFARQYYYNSPDYNSPDYFSPDYFVAQIFREI